VLVLRRGIPPADAACRQHELPLPILPAGAREGDVGGNAALVRDPEKWKPVSRLREAVARTGRAE